MKSEDRKKILIPALLFTLLCLAGIIFILNQNFGQKEGPSLFFGEEERAPEEALLSEGGETVLNLSSDSAECETERLRPVYLTGAVMQEGIYHVPEHFCLYELMELAGGFRKDAAADAVNLAAEIEGGSHIRIPTRNEWQESRADPKSGLWYAGEIGSAETININKASKEELMSLPGIGAKTAEDILAYREANGRFARPEDLMKVPGIKEGKYNKIKDKIQAR